jgi:Rrf2 family protein
MIELALDETRSGILQKEIARKQNISVKYLDHIISSLKAKGLVTNVAGKKSGYRLTRDPENITMHDIFQAFEPEVTLVECISEESLCKRSRSCAARDFWQDFNDHITQYLQSVTLEELKYMQQKKTGNREIMYYI